MSTSASSKPRPGRKPKKSPKPPKCWKLHEDSWGSNPPLVKSYLVYSPSEPSVTGDDSTTAIVHTSPICGFGWRFQLSETFHYSKSDSKPRIQELVGQIDLTLQPHMCSSMPLSNFRVLVKVSHPRESANLLTQEQEFTNIPIQSDSKIGTYNEFSGYHGQVHIEATLVFSRRDDLPLPTTASINTWKALRLSLDGPSFIDTKFYLFSARVGGKPGHPKAVFAKSVLLTESCAYLDDLLSTESSFKNGTPCDLRQDALEEIAKLDADAYDYDSDSDLEDESEVKGKESATTPSSEKIEKEALTEEPAPRLQNGRAFAINGTAYKTWKAFIYYCYTNDIHFNALRTRKSVITAKPVSPDSDTIQCSPKSMYRFADYANLPDLMSLAKEAIQKNLSESNIVAELFSGFTSKYQEIIDLEIRYLVDNFTYLVANDFDKTLEKIVAGSMPHCGQVLKLTIKELRAANSQGTRHEAFGGWGKLAKSPVVQASTSIFGTPLSPTNMSWLPTPNT